MPAGEQIKRLRGRISAQEAANLIGVDVERLRKWESRNANPKDSNDIKAVESYFGVTLNELYKLENFQFIPRATNGAVKREEADIPMNAIHALAESTNKLSDSNLINAKNIERLISLLEIGFGLGSKLEDNQKYFEAREGVNPSPFEKFGDDKKKA